MIPPQNKYILFRKFKQFIFLRNALRAKTGGYNVFHLFNKWYNWFIGQFNPFLDYCAKHLSLRAKFSLQFCFPLSLARPFFDFVFQPFKANWSNALWARLQKYYLFASLIIFFFVWFLILLFIVLIKDIITIFSTERLSIIFHPPLLKKAQWKWLEIITDGEVNS